MSDNSIQLNTTASILFVGNSFTFGRVDPVMTYNAANVRDLTAPVAGTTFANTTGSNPYEPHPWGGVPGIFKAMTGQVGLNYDVAISARNAATLQGQYLNSNPAGWDLRGNVSSQSWDTLVLQDNSTQALPSGSGTITFAAGSSTATLTIDPATDTKVETDETLTVQITANAAYRTSAGAVTGTILNDDPTGPVVNPALPTVTLVASPSAVLEDGSQNLVYTFTRTGSTAAPLIIQFTGARDPNSQPSVAVGTGDFENNVSQFTGSFNAINATTGIVTPASGNLSVTSSTNTVTIPIGASSVTLTLDPRPDTTVESDESIRITLNANAAYNVGTQGAVAVTILNDDFTAGTDLSVPNITLNLPTSSVYENGTDNLIYQFARTGSTAAPLTVQFSVSGTATLPGNDFTVTGADTFTTGGASDPNLQSFNTYAVKLAQYATTGAADGAIPANANANAATGVYLYETWARPNLVTGAQLATTDNTTGVVTTSTTTAPEFYTSLEAMTADLRAAYEGLAAANPIFKGVAPVGAAFLQAVQSGTATRNPYASDALTDGKVDLWWDDNLHASKYGSYLSALTLFGTITGLDPRSLGASEMAASDLGITQAEASALQAVAAATLGLSLNAHWTSPGQVTELQSGTGLLATAGSFVFADSDKADTHTVAVSPITPGAFGTLTTQLRTDSTGDGTGGAVNWIYTVDNDAVKSLAPGATRIERFNVTVTDANGGSAQREVAVTINGTYNDAPAITSNGAGATATVTIAENSAAVTTVTASDVDTPGSGLSYSVVGGADQNLFQIDSATGVLTFKSAPDFENPADAGGNNVYDVTVQVSDGTSVATQALAVTVTNTNDAPVLDTTPALLFSATTNNGTPAGVAGTLVSDLVGSFNVTDPDGPSFGLVLVGLDTSHGQWYVTTDGGVIWSNIGMLSDTTALRLAADANTRLYFRTNPGYSGTVSNAIRFRAWDGSAGSNLSTATDTLTNGGSSSYSTAFETVDLKVVDPTILELAAGTHSLVGNPLTGIVAIKLTSTAATNVTLASSAQAQLFVSTAGTDDTVTFDGYLAVSDVAALAAAGVEHIQFKNADGTVTQNYVAGKITSTRVDYAPVNTYFEHAILSYDASGALTSVETAFDSGIIETAYYAGGARTHLTKADTLDAFGWDTQDYTYKPDGASLASLLETQDNGDTLLTTYGNQSTSFLYTDLSHSSPLASRLQTQDLTGKPTGATITYDDGQIVTLDYTDGVLTHYENYDSLNASAGFKRHAVDYANGVQVRELLTLDNNDTYDIRTPGGVLSQTIFTDGSNTAPFQSVTVDITGGVTTRTATLHDSGLLSEQFFAANGHKTRYVQTDTANVFDYDTFSYNYAADGTTILNALTISDNGHRDVVNYEDGGSLQGAAFNDTLIGHLGMDTFVFGPGGGSDYVSNFENGVDKLDLSAFNIPNFGSLYVENNGTTGVYLSFGGGQHLAVNGVTLAQFDPTDVKLA